MSHRPLFDRYGNWRTQAFAKLVDVFAPGAGRGDATGTIPGEAGPVGNRSVDAALQYQKVIRRLIDVLIDLQDRPDDLDRAVRACSHRG